MKSKALNRVKKFLKPELTWGPNITDLFMIPLMPFFLLSLLKNRLKKVVKQTGSKSKKEK